MGKLGAAGHVPSLTHTEPTRTKPAAQTNPHAPDSQVATPLAGAGHGEHSAPQVAALLLLTQAPPHSCMPVMQTKPQVPPVQVGAAPEGATHAFPQRPQWESEVPKLLSHPLAAEPSQLPIPALHAKPHAPPSQLGVALLGVGHRLLQLPQCATSLCGLWHEPAQKTFGELQMLAQLPPEHTVPTGHATPQAPQCAELVASAASQPLLAIPSQLPKPDEHAPSPHPAPVQVALPLGGVGHAASHVPQWATDEARLVSQPLVVTPSQLPNPTMQVNPQVPLPQVAVALGTAGHALPHAPQCSLLVARVVSQPLVAAPSQLPKPAMQVPIPHTPPRQADEAFAGETQVFPHAPQFETVVRRLTSHPLRWSRSQSA